MLARLKGFAYSILVWLDEGANAFLIGFIGIFVTIPVPDEGNAHNTVSQVFAQLRQQTIDAEGHKVGCIACKVLTWLFHWGQKPDYDHCTDALTPGG